MASAYFSEREAVIEEPGLSISRWVTRGCRKGRGQDRDIGTYCTTVCWIWERAASRKPTHKDRYLYVDSYHHPRQKLKCCKFS
ncbi:hypothetical protein Trydic_g4850, partial [Trypoxylus dichotomus]